MQKDKAKETINRVCFFAFPFWLLLCNQLKGPSVDEWIKQLRGIHTMESYSAIKKNKNFPFVAVWMGIENIMLSEISQLEKDKYHMISFKCAI